MGIKAEESSERLTSVRSGPWTRFFVFVDAQESERERERERKVGSMHGF